MQLIDTHAHIYLAEFDVDRADVIENAKKGGVKLVIMPAIDSNTHGTMVALEQEYTLFKSMMGLHPCSVRGIINEELNIVEQWLGKHQFIAIGEIGLDLYWDKTFIDQQYYAFHHQIGLAISHNLPVVIHSRNAIDECIEVVKQYPALTGVFHCFSGNLYQAEQIIQTRFLLGIGGVVTYKNAGLDKVIEQIGLNSVVLETDAPYLAPVPFRGKRNESSYLTYIAQKIADITNTQVEEVALVTTQNAMKLFKLL